MGPVLRDARLLGRIIRNHMVRSHGTIGDGPWTMDHGGRNHLTLQRLLSQATLSTTLLLGGGLVAHRPRDVVSDVIKKEFPSGWFTCGRFKVVRS